MFESKFGAFNGIYAIKDKVWHCEGLYCETAVQEVLFGVCGRNEKGSRVTTD